MTSVAEDFIAYLYQKKEQITSTATKKARQCLIDYCAAAEGGSFVERNRTVAAMEHLSPGVVPVIGTKKVTDGKTAALLNGFHAHTLELDDGHRFAMIHLGGPIISALYSAYNETEMSLSSLLIGIVMGYEAACRVAIAMQPSHKHMGFHTAGTCGTIGAAIGTAFALQLSPKQMGTVLAAAVTAASGMLEIQEQGSELKPYNIGNAAMNGLTAAYFGGCGLEPPMDILNGERGFFRIFAQNFSQDRLCEAAEYFEIERIYVKIHSSCRHCHAPVDAALKIRNAYAIVDEDIFRVTVYTYLLAVKGHDHTKIYNSSSAKLSIPFCTAAALLYGKNDVSIFSDNILHDEVIQRLTEKVAVVEDSELTKDKTKRVARVEVQMKDGTVYTEQIEYAKGEPEFPLTEQELLAKARGLMEFAHVEADAISVTELLWDDSKAALLKQL